jgi:hypothetical protein
MFSQLSEAITCATNEVEQIENGYSEKRQSTAVKIQKEMEAELERMKTQVALKDYSPIEHHNKIATFNSEYQTMSVAEKNECEAVKNKLYDQLMNLMQKNTCPISEMYKVIGADPHNQAYICRVWFTLVPMEQWNCVPGDPIRIEWVHVGGTQRPDDKTCNISATANRSEVGVMGLQIPQFDAEGLVVGHNNFYNINQWGDTSNHRTWWEQWLQTNRPC